MSRAGSREPLRTEQQRGPQHEVKLAASKERQSGNRAAHFTAKATPTALDSERAAGPGGVGSAARVEGVARNTRGPYQQPSSRHRVSDKPKAKSRAAERESEATVVSDLEETEQVDLSSGQHGLDFLGCTLRKRMSGSICERERRRVDSLQRESSAKSRQRVRQREKALTSRSRSGVKDVRVIIRDLDPLLRGRENLKTGNAAKRFNHVDSYAWGPLKGFMKRRKGHNLAIGDLEKWDRHFFWNHGLPHLRGTVQNPEAA